MTNRREFLQTGVSVTSLPLALNVLLPAATASARASYIVPHSAVFDNRYVEGRTFAAATGRLGVSTRALDNGDVTSFWYDELDAIWRERPAAIAGTTQFGPMFVLERLAAERGMRVVLRAEHSAHPDGTMTHEITGPAETVRLAEHLQRREVDWPVLVAVLAAHCPIGRATPVTRTVTTPGAKPEPDVPAGEGMPETVIHYYTSAAIRDGQGVPWDGPLFSWLIAPKARA
jgi:hypothetical protein